MSAFTIILIVIVAFLAGHQLQRASSGHYEEIAQIATPPHATHLREGEALDGPVFVTVTGTVVAAGNGIGADLHHAPGRSGAGESLSQPMIGAGGLDIGAGADKGIHVVCRTADLLPGGRAGRGAGRPKRQDAREDENSRFPMHIYSVYMFFLIYVFSYICSLHVCPDAVSVLRSRRPQTPKRSFVPDALGTCTECGACPYQSINSQPVTS